jgi:hypothetical protein
VPGEARRGARLGRVSAVSADARRFWFRREAVRRATPSEHRDAGAAPRVGGSTHGPQVLQRRLFRPACMTAGLARRTRAVRSRCGSFGSAGGEKVLSVALLRRVGEAVGRRPSGRRWCARGAVSICVVVAVGARAPGCSTPVAWLGGRARCRRAAASSAGVRRRIKRDDHAGVSGDSCTVVLSEANAGDTSDLERDLPARVGPGVGGDRVDAGPPLGARRRGTVAHACRGACAERAGPLGSLARQRRVAGRAGGGAVMAGARRGETKRGRRGDPSGRRTEKGVRPRARRVSRPPTRGERR